MAHLDGVLRAPPPVGCPAAARERLTCRPSPRPRGTGFASRPRRSPGSAPSAAGTSRSSATPLSSSFPSSEGTRRPSTSVSSSLPPSTVSSSFPAIGDGEVGIGAVAMRIPDARRRVGRPSMRRAMTGTSTARSHRDPAIGWELPRQGRLSDGRSRERADRRPANPVDEPLRRSRHDPSRSCRREEGLCLASSRPWGKKSIGRRERANGQCRRWISDRTRRRSC